MPRQAGEWTTPFRSQSRTASDNSSDFTNSGRGLLLTLDVSASAGSPTLDVKVQSYDVVSRTYTDIPGAAFAQKTGISTDTLLIYPGITATANRQVNSVVIGVYRVVATIAGTDPDLTFSVSAVSIE